MPQTICAGRQGSLTAGCGESYEAYFGASGVVTSSGSYNSYTPSFPGYPIEFYNVKGSSTIGSPTTSSLTQGVMSITPLLTTAATTATVYYIVETRPSFNASGTGWSAAIPVGQGSGMGPLQISATSGTPGTDTLTFNTVGEYRVITTNVLCEGSGTTTLVVNFGDATYPGSCTGPL